jgi:hypothetical protein
MRVAAKAVVHSSNQIVTNADLTEPSPDVTDMFHAQVVDLKDIRRFGTFFANLSGGPVFTALRACCVAASTDLSTDRVDKGESRFASDSCVRYVTSAATMTRNCTPLLGGDRAAAGRSPDACSSGAPCEPRHTFQRRATT